MNNDDLHSNYDGISSVIPNVKNTIDNQNANASQENSSNEYNSVGSSEPVGIVPTVLPPSVNSSGIVNQVNDEDGVIILGVTRFRWWNQLIGCQVKLPFESWALAVWDALVNMSKGGNKDALEHGLSVEIAKKAQREEEYNWVVECVL